MKYLQGFIPISSFCIIASKTALYYSNIPTENSCAKNVFGK